MKNIFLNAGTVSENPDGSIFIMPEDSLPLMKIQLKNGTFLVVVDSDEKSAYLSDKWDLQVPTKLVKGYTGMEIIEAFNLIYSRKVNTYVFFNNVNRIKDEPKKISLKILEKASDQDLKLFMEEDPVLIQYTYESLKNKILAKQ